MVWGAIFMDRQKRTLRRIIICFSVLFPRSIGRMLQLFLLEYSWPNFFFQYFLPDGQKQHCLFKHAKVFIGRTLSFCFLSTRVIYCVYEELFILYETNYLYVSMTLRHLLYKNFLFFREEFKNFDILRGCEYNVDRLAFASRPQIDFLCATLYRSKFCLPYWP